MSLGSIDTHSRSLIKASKLYFAKNVFFLHWCQLYQKQLFSYTDWHFLLSLKSTAMIFLM